MYSLNKITPITNLNKRELSLVNSAIDVAEKSEFTSSLRLGAVLQQKGSCFLRE